MMDKTHIEELRKAAKARFDGATTPEAVKSATEELAHIDEIEKETEELEKTSASLLASYKSIIKNQPIKKDPAENDDEGEEDEEGKALGFDEALAKVIAARKKEG